MVTLLFTTNWPRTAATGRSRPPSNGSNVIVSPSFASANAWRRFVWTPKPSPTSVTMIVAARAVVNATPSSRSQMIMGPRNGPLILMYWFMLGCFLLPLTNGSRVRCCTKSCGSNLTVNSRGKLVDFDQAIAGPAVSAFQDGRVIAWRDGDENGRLQDIRRCEARVL